jgi:hypothetical protein
MTDDVTVVVLCHPPTQDKHGCQSCVPNHIQPNIIAEIQKVVEISSRVKAKSGKKKLHKERPACTLYFIIGMTAAHS